MNNEYKLTYIRWTARIFLVVLLFQLIRYFYYIIYLLEFHYDATRVLAVCKGNVFLTIVLAGAIIAWKRETLGGILITAGLISFHLSNCSEGGYFSFLAFTFWPGILFTLYGLTAKRYSNAAVKKDTDELTISETAPKYAVITGSHLGLSEK